MPASSSKITAVMVGSSLKNKGGMISVVQCYQKAGFLNDKRYCVTHQDGGTLLRLWLFICGLCQLTYWILRYPDIRVVHIHVSERGSFLRKSIVQAIAKTFGKKTILHMHGAEFVAFYQGLPTLLKKWARATLLSADTIIALSQRWAKDLQEICPNAKIQIVYNPCEISVRPQNKSDKELVTFLFLGRFGQRKGAYDLVKAASLLQNTTFVIKMHGDGEIDDVSEYVERLGMTSHVKVASWLSFEEKEQAMHESDVLVLPSYNEGLPMAILEALGYGLPVISTPVGGIPEAVENGINGYLVPPGEPEQLASKMEILIQSSEERHRMGQASLEKAGQQFEITTVLNQLKILYQRLERR